MIIAAYAGTGKTTFANQIHSAIDIKSMPYAWFLPRLGDTNAEFEAAKGAMDHVRNPLYPRNMVLDILKAEREYAYVIMPTVSEAIDILQEEFGREVVLCYPEDGLEEEYRQRYIARGNSGSFLRLFVDNMDQFIEPLKTNKKAMHLVLKSGEYLSDRLDALTALRRNVKTEPVSEELLSEFRDALKEDGRENWIYLRKGATREFYCSIADESTPTAMESDDIYCIGKLLGPELNFCLGATMFFNTRQLLSAKTVDRDTFLKEAESLRKGFDVYKENPDKYRFMTFEMLSEIIERHNIPKNVRLMSDSGWEVDATDMCGVFYNEQENILVFTQHTDDSDHYSNEKWRIVTDEVFESLRVYERAMIYLEKYSE